MKHNNHQANNSTGSPTRASVTEVDEFLKHVKGKGPRETLGAVAGNQLFLSMIQATVGCLIVMGLLTVGPYLWSRQSPDDNAAVKTPEPKDKPDAAKNETKTPEQPKPGDKAGTTTADNKKDKGVPSKDIVDKLKENETKAGTPKDPFGPNIDDLIDKK